MKKRNIIYRNIAIILILIGISIFIFQPFTPKEPPKIRITYNGEELYYVVEKDEWNGSKYDHLDVLMQIFAISADNTMVYVPEGETVEIEFLGKAPKSYTLTKELCRDNPERIEVPIDFQSKKGTFVHTTSDMKNIGDSTLFGYRLTCQWGRNTCEYGFYIRLIG